VHISAKWSNLNITTTTTTTNTLWPCVYLAQLWRYGASKTCTQTHGPTDTQNDRSHNLLQCSLRSHLAEIKMRHFEAKKLGSECLRSYVSGYPFTPTPRVQHPRCVSIVSAEQVGEGVGAVVRQPESAAARRLRLVWAGAGHRVQRSRRSRSRSSQPQYTATRPPRRLGQTQRRPRL